ncbi:MAG: hypothetical protein U0169_20550 [Polyangiaceae bacterium]
MTHDPVARAWRSSPRAGFRVLVMIASLVAMTGEAWAADAGGVDSDAGQAPMDADVTDGPDVPDGPDDGDTGDAAEVPSDAAGTGTAGTSSSAGAATPATCTADDCNGKGAAKDGGCSASSVRARRGGDGLAGSTSFVATTAFALASARVRRRRRR